MTDSAFDARHEDARDWPVIMQVLIGSQAHGLADEASDWDVRQVFVIPSERLLTPMLNKPKDAWSDKERSNDNIERAGWEVGKIVRMAMEGHPNSVEVFFAPDFGTLTSADYSGKLRALVPAIVPAGPFARGAIGYGKNCVTKLKQSDRRKKWASTYLRALYASSQFMRTGVMPVKIGDFELTEARTNIFAARSEELTIGEVVDLGDVLERNIKRQVEEGCALPALPDKILAHETVRDIRADFERWL